VVGGTYSAESQRDPSPRRKPEEWRLLRSLRWTDFSWVVRAVRWQS